MASSDASFRKLGTVAFGEDFMRPLIGPNPYDPRELCLGLWWSFVPEAYRPPAEALVRRIGEKYLGHKLDARTIDAFAYELSAAALRMEPRGLGPPMSVDAVLGAFGSANGIEREPGMNADVYRAHILRRLGFVRR